MGHYGSNWFHLGPFCGILTHSDALQVPADYKDELKEIDSLLKQLEDPLLGATEIRLAKADLITAASSLKKTLDK